MTLVHLEDNKLTIRFIGKKNQYWEYSMRSLSINTEHKKYDYLILYRLKNASMHILHSFNPYNNDEVYVSTAKK